MWSKTIICGNLGRDPEVNASGTVTRASIAVSSREKQGDQWIDATQWFDLVAFGKTGEFLRQYGAKGRTVLAEGRVKLVEFDKKDGSRGAKLEFVCDILKLIGSRGESRPSDSAPADIPF